MKKITIDKLVLILDGLYNNDNAGYFDTKKAVEFLITFGLIDEAKIESVEKLKPETKKLKHRGGLDV